MNFFPIFYEFFITRRVETKWIDNFYFPCFSVYSNLLWLETKPQWYFYIFGIFFLFFWNFLLRVGYEWNGMTIFVFRLSRPFTTYFGLKWSHNCVFLIFLNFLLFFLEFSITRHVGTEHDDSFYFIPFSAFPPLFWLEMEP